MITLVFDERKEDLGPRYVPASEENEQSDLSQSASGVIAAINDSEIEGGSQTDVRTCKISQVLSLRQRRWHFNPSNDIYSGSVKFPPAMQHRHWKKGKRPFHWTNCPIGPLVIDQSQHKHCRSFRRGVRNGMGDIDVGRNDPRPTSELFLRSYRVCSEKGAIDRAASEQERTPHVKPGTPIRRRCLLGTPTAVPR